MDTPVTLEQMTAEQIKTKLMADGSKLLGYRETATKAIEAVKTARDEWEAKPEVKTLFDAQQQAVSVRDQAETNIRALQSRLYELTGEANPHPAFQVRVNQTPTYEADEVTNWLLGLLRQFMKLDTKSVDVWLKDIATPSGSMPSFGGLPPVPALMLKKPTTAIFTAGLERLAAKPAPVEEPPADPDGLQEVQDRLNVLVKTPAIEPIPVPVADPMGDIPF